MQRRPRFAFALPFLLAAFLPPATLLADEFPRLLDPDVLGEAWATERFVKTPAPCLKPAELEKQLHALAALYPEDLKLEELGRSVEQRPIYRMTLGRGKTKVMLWSQMHGDEPSATPALLDLADYLLGNRHSFVVSLLLDRLTLILVPMLNPDGAEVYTRRNRQGIDINRDALNLATPEGRLLKQLRDAENPVLGFNLHDQNRRRTVGTSRVLATNAVLAVVGDEAKTLTSGRILAKRAAVAIADALEPFAPGGLARYDDTFSPRSFGDNLTAWGTPVVLIESGGVQPRASLEELTRLNFIALGATLFELALNGLEQRDADGYDAIPENNVDVYSDVILRGGRLRQPGIAEPYRADIAFDRLRGDREAAGCQPPGLPRSEIAELGDARVFGAGQGIDAGGQILFPAFTVGADGWAARKFLDDAALDQLAKLGVAQVRWVVAGRDLAAAADFAAKRRGRSRPRIEVTADRKALPAKVLARRPSLPSGRELGELVRSLEEASHGGRSGDLDAALAALWKDGPGLRYEGIASFLAANAGNNLAADSPVTHIFLDGVEVK
jgi:hypothetical protein